MLLERDFSLDTVTGIEQRRLSDVDVKMKSVTRFILKYPAALGSVKVWISA